MNGPACAAAGCDNAVERHPGQLGRPPIYCSPACRPSRTASGARCHISVEVEQHGHDGDQPGRCWVVTLHRGTNTFVVGRDLGRISATVLAGELQAFLQQGAQREGDTID